MIPAGIHGLQFLYPVELIITVGVGQPVDPIIHLFNIIIDRNIEAIKRPKKSIGCPNFSWHFFNVIFSQGLARCRCLEAVEPSKLITGNDAVFTIQAKIDPGPHPVLRYGEE